MLAERGRRWGSNERGSLRAPELADMPLSVEELDGVGEGVVLLVPVVVGSWI